MTVTVPVPPLPVTPGAEGLCVHTLHLSDCREAPPELPTVCNVHLYRLYIYIYI